MKKIIQLLLFVLLICIVGTTAFSQIPKKDISRKLTKSTLKGLDNDLIADFLKDFSKAIRKEDFTALKEVVSEEFYKNYLIVYNEKREECDSSIEEQTRFLRSSIYTYVDENRFYGDYMKEFYTIKDWTEIKKIRYTRFVYRPVNDERFQDYWAIKGVFIMENNDYYLGTITCRIDEKTNKVVLFSAH